MNSDIEELISSVNRILLEVNTNMATTNYHILKLNEGNPQEFS